MDLEEDIPSNWRVACDKATGVEYYYHKKTRLSQWTKPACLVALEEEEEAVVVDVAVAEQGKVEAAVDAQRFQAAAASSSAPTTKSAAQTATPLADYDVVLNLEQQLSTLTGLASIIRNSSASGEGILEEAISVLYSCILPSTCDEILSQESTLLPSLIQICMQTKRVSIRRASLCCLFCFSLGRRNEQLFCTNQAWVSLSDFVEKWQRLEDDTESGLLFCCIVSLLLRGNANRVISEDSVLHLSEWTTRLLDDKNQKGLDLENMALTHPSPEGECLFDGAVLQTLAKSTAGVPLSALVLLALAKQALRKRKYAQLFLQKGAGLSSLLLVCQCPWAATLVKKKTRQHLLELLATSSYSRSTVLDSFLALSSAISLLPETVGRDPLCCHNATIGISRSEEEGEEEEDNEQDAEEDPEEGVEKRESITDMLAKEVVVPFSGAKDVVWKPREKKGTSYRVSSIVLWSHCPELRGTIESLWAEGEGGELELGTNTSQEALASVVKFIHSGVLIPPPSPNSRLELVKLAAELGSEPMLEAASNACLQHLTEETCGAALALARNMGLIEFEEALEIFLATGRRDSQQENDEVFSSFHDDVMLLDEEEEVSFFASEEFATKPSSRGAETETSNSSNNTQRSRSAPSSHMPPPQSGGIYGLLLGNNSAGTSKPGNNNHLNGAAANRRIPGKVPLDGKPATSAFGASNNNNKGRGGGRAGAYAGRGSGVGRGSTPSKQTAGTRGGRGGGAGLTHSTEGSWFAEEEGLHEFDTKMSLAPEREPSQREKRLQGLAAPKQPALAKLTIPSPFDDGEEKQILLVPKSSDSPSRKNKEVLANKDQDGEKETGVAKTTIDQSVRVSLALLKSKGLRRRRSVVDVENEESVRLEKEMDEKKEAEGKEEDQEVEENECTADTVVVQTSRNPVSGRKQAVLSEHATHQKAIATPKRASAQCTRTSGCQCSDCLVSDESSASLPTWQSQVRSEIASARKLHPQAEEDAASNEEHDGGDEVSGEALSECGNCGRRFRQEALTRHAKICEKVFLQKRKAFDSKRMRTQDNPELVSIVSSSKKQASTRSSVDNSSSGGGGGGGGKWKSESNAFREAMRNARETAQCVQLGLPLPPPIASAPDPSLIPCPHCGRRFNQKAGERHIPMCQNILAKPNVLKKGTGQGAVSASLKTNVASNGRGRF